MQMPPFLFIHSIILSFFIFWGFSSICHFVFLILIQCYSVAALLAFRIGMLHRIVHPFQGFGFDFACNIPYTRRSILPDLSFLLDFLCFLSCSSVQRTLDWTLYTCTCNVWLSAIALSGILEFTHSYPNIYLRIFLLG